MAHPNARHRIEAIQVLRAVAAVLVVVIHANDIDNLRLDWARSWIGSIPSLSHIGAIGVDIFFVISGFVMAAAAVRREGLSARDFLRDRFRRVLPFYWLASMAFLVLLNALDRPILTEGLASSLTVVPLLNPMHFTQPILYVGWSLGFELAFYGVVAAMLALRINPSFLLPGLLFVTCAFATFGAVFSPATNLVAFWLSPFWFEFAFGIAIFMLYRANCNRIPATAGLLATVCALGGFAHALYSNPPAEIWLPERILDQGLGLLRVVWWGIPSGALVLASLWWSDSAKLSPKVQPSGLWLALLALGDASYALYLIHPFVIAPIQYLFPAIPWGVDILVAGAVVVSCGAAIVVHRLVEQPLLAELRGTRNRPGTANVRAAPNVHA